MTQDTKDKTVEEVATAALEAPVATFAQLRAKPRRTMTFPLSTQDENGDEIVMRMKYRALSPKEYDELIEAHPPTTEQKRNGATYNIDSFAPAIIAAVSAEPKLTLEQAKEIYTSPDWSGGELSSLYIRAMQVCNAGLDVPFNARD